MLISFVSQVCTFHHDIKRLQELHEVLQSMKPAQIAINVGRVMKAASLPYVGFCDEQLDSEFVTRDGCTWSRQNVRPHSLLAEKRHNPVTSALA